MRGYHYFFYLVLLYLYFISSTIVLAETKDEKGIQFIFGAVIQGEQGEPEKLLFDRSLKVSILSQIAFYLNPQECYVYLFCVSSDERVFILFPETPGDFDSNTYFNTERILPDISGGSAWYSPYREGIAYNRIELIASRDKIKVLDKCIKDYFKLDEDSRNKIMDDRGRVKNEQDKKRVESEILEMIQIIKNNAKEVSDSITSAGDNRETLLEKKIPYPDWGGRVKSSDLAKYADIISYNYEIYTESIKLEYK